MRITPNDVNVKRNTIAAAASDRRPQGGSVTLTNVRQRRAPSDAGRLLVVRVEVRPEAPDGAHHHGVVEEHVGEEDRPERLAVECRAPEEQRERRPTTTVGSTNGTSHQRADEPTGPGSDSGRARTPRGGATAGP